MGKGEVAHWYVEHMEVLYGSADLNNADAVLIESAIIHPDFNPGNLSNDIALIKDLFQSSLGEKTITYY